MVKHLIFAYGSNLNSDDFKQYCVEKQIAPFLLQKVCNAKLKNHSLCWTTYSKRRSCGVLNIMPQKDASVWGVIYELDDSQLEVFDKKEGAPKKYNRVCVFVADADNKVYQVETYIAKHCLDTAYYYPSKNYKEVVLDGMTEQGLPSEYIESFRKSSPIIDFDYSGKKCTCKTAIYSGTGVKGKTIGYWQNLYEKHDLGSLSILYSDLFTEEELQKYDLLIIPGGDSKNICGGLGDFGKKSIRTFLKKGGKLLGVCAGAYAVSQQNRTYLNVSPVVIPDVDHTHRGEVLANIKFTEEGKSFFPDVEEEIVPIIYHNGPIVQYNNDCTCSDFTVLATFDEEIYFPDSMHKSFGTPAIWQNKYGDGMVYAVSPHIERTSGKEYLMGIFISEILLK
ncbi:MAG: gamma-glutamylcyclotransferase [Bacteroidales bacterium]|nr:gamma-glutamylcyclotransferase [Bacteroidales bacterium]